MRKVKLTHGVSGELHPMAETAKVANQNSRAVASARGPKTGNDLVGWKTREGEVRPKSKPPAE